MSTELFLFIPLSILILAYIVVRWCAWTRELDKSIFAELVYLDNWMTCPKCPNSNFNLAEEHCIIECATCHTSYIVDTANSCLVERK